MKELGVLLVLNEALNSPMLILKPQVIIPSPFQEQNYIFESIFLDDQVVQNLNLGICSSDLKYMVPGPKLSLQNVPAQTSSSLPC